MKIQSTLQKFDEKFECQNFVCEEHHEQIKSFICEQMTEMVEEMIKKIDGMKLVDSAQAGQFAMHADGYNEALEDAQEELKEIVE